ncbi:MAG: STELLO glycosyltransferase family protein [Ignavibacteria bacterium]
MKKSIVITSIFNPTEAVVSFSRMNNYQLIVVGDKKTPLDWHADNVDYISVTQQGALDFELAKVLPFNHYCRKMIGYLKAIQNGAVYIVDTDDDNNPKDNWTFPEFENIFESIPENKGFVNIYELFTEQKIWARGLPLNLINKRFDLEKSLKSVNCRIGIWQGLADEDPDVDAIYRLTNDTPCYFNEREPVVLGKGTISPFNTQNTIIRKELFPLLYLPTYVTFRFTDILRGLVAQPIMWLYDYKLGFVNATVVQKRNPHDYMKDFISEIPMYQNCEKVIELVVNSILSTDSIESNIYNAYHSLLRSKIVCGEEIKTLEAWLKDLGKII